MNRERDPLTADPRDPARHGPGIERHLRRHGLRVTLLLPQIAQQHIVGNLRVPLGIRRHADLVERMTEAVEQTQE
jgi:hypothetical protein